MSDSKTGKTVVVTGTVQLMSGDVFLRANDVVLALYKMGYSELAEWFEETARKIKTDAPAFTEDES